MYCNYYNTIYTVSVTIHDSTMPDTWLTISVVTCTFLPHSIKEVYLRTLQKYMAVFVNKCQHYGKLETVTIKNAKVYDFESSDKHVKTFENL